MFSFKPNLRELDSADVGRALGNVDDQIRVHVNSASSTRDYERPIAHTISSRSIPLGSPEYVQL